MKIYLNFKNTHLLNHFGEGNISFTFFYINNESAIRYALLKKTEKKYIYNIYNSFFYYINEMLKESIKKNKIKHLNLN